jgi:uncharacterized protein YceK
MKNACVCLTVALLAGCSSSSKSTSPQSASPQSTSPKMSRLEEAAKNESSRLGAPSQPLSAFSDFELKPMELSAGVAERKEKAEVAKQLEDKLRTRLLPLLEEWKADKTGPRTAGTLVIQPKLQSLRIVSGGARFMIGGLSGDSVVDMNLELVDGKTGTVIANPRISRTASGIGGAWTVGGTDRNLLNYIVEIAHQYLVDNYKK